MLILFKQSWTDEERRFFRSEPKAPASYAALMAHRYKHTQIQTHLYRSFIQRIQFPRILFLGCDFGLHIREILPSLRIWHTFTISFRVCVCVCVRTLHTYGHTYTDTRTHRRRRLNETKSVSLGGRPQKRAIFFLLFHFGAPARAATRNTRRRRAPGLYATTRQNTPQGALLPRRGGREL